MTTQDDNGTRTPLAHISESRRESMSKHLEAVSALAGTTAEKFGLRETAETLARFHDLGKFSDEFQQYLRRSAGDSEEAPAHGPDHSTAGARFLAKNLPVIGTLFAYCKFSAGLRNLDRGFEKLRKQPRGRCKGVAGGKKKAPVRGRFSF